MEDLFTHKNENTKANIAAYNEQKVRLSLNCWILLFAMLEQKHITGLDCTKGISFRGMNQPVVMTEYRRRFADLIAAGVEIMKVKHSNGFKEFFIPLHLISKYQDIYLPYKQQILSKINAK